MGRLILICAAGLAVSGAASAQTMVVPSPVEVPRAPPPLSPIVAPIAKLRPATPTHNPVSWVTENDYPNAALYGGHQGTTGFRVTISAAGFPIGCEITDTSGWAELDGETCSIVFKRARFIPATDKTGQTTVGTWASRIRWTLPEDPEPDHTMPSASTESYIVGTDGRVTDCQLSEGGIDVLASPDGDPCTYGAEYAPYRDASGKPVRKKVTTTITVTVTDPAPSAVKPSEVPPVPPKKRRKP